MATRSSIPAGSTKSSPVSKTSWRRCIRRSASIGRSPFTTHPQAALTHMSILSARMVSFLPMSFRVFTRRIGLLACPVILAIPAFAGEPGMVFIPGGEYMRGRSHEHPDSNLPYYPNPLRDDLPVRKLYVDPFYLDQTEVTNERYLAFLKATGHRRPY